MSIHTTFYKGVRVGDHIIGLLASISSTLMPIAAKHPFASMTNLSRSAEAFFTFQMLIFVSFLVMQGFFRLLGILCNGFHQAYRLGAFFIPNMILYTGCSGFIIPFSRKLKHSRLYYSGVPASTLAVLDGKLVLPLQRCVVGSYYASSTTSTL